MKRVLAVILCVTAVFAGICIADSRAAQVSSLSAGQAFAAERAGAHTVDVTLLGEQYVLDYSALEPVVRFYKRGAQALRTLAEPALTYAAPRAELCAALLREQIEPRVSAIRAWAEQNRPAGTDG